MNILVIDSDASDREVLCDLLRQEGYQVGEAADDLQALERTSEDMPDLIIMDVTAPSANGLDCTRRFKGDVVTRDIPIMLIGTRAEPDGAIRALTVGADEYVTKPLDPRELILRVQALTRLRARKLELLRNTELLGEHARTMCLLLEFSRRLAAASTLDTVLEETISMTTQLTCCRRVSIMLPDTEGKHLMIARAVGMAENLAAQIRVPIGGSVAGRVFLSGAPLVVNTPGDQDHAPEYDSQFFVSLPLMSTALTVSGQAVGVLNVTERQGHTPFTPLELEYVELISNIAASAIDDVVTRQARDEARDSVVVGLAKLAEFRDNDTGRHLDRVTRYACILATELRIAKQPCPEIDDQFLCDLKRAVLLHDIGKVAVPDHVLLKPGRPTAHETSLLMKHAQIGAQTIHSILQRAPGTQFLHMAEEIAYTHHEWYDGSGYPRGLRGRDIPLAARIAALADVYDALTTKRPYKDIIPHEEAVAIICSASGSQFDPVIVQAFLRRQHEFAVVAAELADNTFPPASQNHADQQDKLVATL